MDIIIELKKKEEEEILRNLIEKWQLKYHSKK